MGRLTVSLGLLIMTVFSLEAIACGDGEGASTETGQPTPTPVEDVVITIGNLSDLTGVSSNAMVYVNIALDDLVEYYNENDLIPGVRLKVVTWDGQMDPARDIAGYEWLKENGADLIFTPIPAAPITLKSRANGDKVVLFALATNRDAILPPGYVFNLGTSPQYDACTLLKWIAENHWDFATKGPAKVGGASWDESHARPFLAAMEEYCAAHPDQFEWDGGYLTGYSLTWGPEVEALKDCDYVYPGIVMMSFVKQYRDAGHTEARFLGSDTQAAFFGLVNDADLWDDIDGMLFLKYPRWWNEEGEIISLVKKLVQENHPDKAETIIRSGNGYLAMNQMYSMLGIIADAAEAEGPRNIDSQALYDAATSYVLMTDGVQRFSFGTEKRDAVDAYGIYEARAAERDIFRLHDDWYPTVRSP